jgi:hypothetical protein
MINVVITKNNSEFYIVATFQLGNFIIAFGIRRSLFRLLK